MEKSSLFNDELGYIKNDKVRESAKVMIDLLPDYFFEVEASSTGKYHPKYSAGVGGLKRHTKAAVRFAYELLQDPTIGDKYTELEQDLMLMGLLLHDGLKSGLVKEKYTRFDHPLLISKYIEENKDKLMLNDDEIKFVQSVVETHMGGWTTDYFGNEVLEKPKTKYQNFVHMCDFLASRKAILFEFDDDDNITC